MSYVNFVFSVPEESKISKILLILKLCFACFLCVLPSVPFDHNIFKLLCFLLKSLNALNQNKFSVEDLEFCFLFACFYERIWTPHVSAWDCSCLV